MDDAVTVNQRLQECPHCGTILDMSAEEPLSEVVCPSCQNNVVVEGKFNHFTLLEKIGSGGMGSVFRANDENLNRMVALKLLRPGSDDAANDISILEREARLTASINHPNVVKVFSYGTDYGVFYLAMELVDKGSLDDLITLQGRVSESQVLEIGIQVAQGLHAAHQKGLIHRDVKPGNILFADAHSAKIVDFGLAILMEQEAEARGEIWGTPYYVAPEKLNQEPEDFRSDIYSLGGTLFHALAGRPPFEAENASMVALKHIKSQAVSLQAFAPGISNHTSYVINQMLKKDPSKRQQSYEELIGQLQYARAQVTEKSNRPKKPRERVVVESQHTPVIVGTLSALILILVLVGVVFLYQYRDQIFSPTRHSPAPALQDDGALHGTSSQIYSQAQSLILDQEFADAAELLDTLLTQRQVSQPLRNWAFLHLGMAQLLESEPDAARQTFNRLFDQGLFSESTRHLWEANFFLETARLLREERPVSTGVLRIYNLETAEAFSILLFGLKNWQDGAFSEAGQLLAAFNRTEPPRNYEWIGRYRALAGRVHEDIHRLQQVEEAAEDRPESETRAAALQALERLNFGGPVEVRLRELAGLTPEPAVEADEEEVAPTD